MIRQFFHWKHLYSACSGYIPRYPTDKYSCSFKFSVVWYDVLLYWQFISNMSVHLCHTEVEDVRCKNLKVILTDKVNAIVFTIFSLCTHCRVSVCVYYYCLWSAVCTEVGLQNVSVHLRHGVDPEVAEGQGHALRAAIHHFHQGEYSQYNFLLIQPGLLLELVELE